MRARGLGRTRRGIIGAGVLLVLGVALACCQQLLSIDGTIRVQDAAAMDVEEAATEAGDAGEAGIDCGITVPEGACADCVTASCCPQLSACAGDPQCKQLEACLLACGSDYECRSACNSAAYPVGGQTDIPAVDTCVAARCRGPCGMACGQAASYTTPADAAGACQTCIAIANKMSVCTAALACFTSLACQTSGHCAQACTTPDCRSACANDAGDDPTLLNAALSEGLFCYAPCRVGRNWTCVNHVVWPPAQDPASQRATLTLIDPFTASATAPPVTGAAVNGCSANDPTSCTPLSTGISDDAGVVALANLGNFSFLGFQGYFEMAAPAYVRNIFYLSFPLSQPNAQLTLGLMSQTTLASQLAQLDITPIAGRGTVWVQVLDCLLLPAPNVVVKADGIDPANVAYFVQNTPSLTATSTDFTGYAFIYNVPPGPLTLRAISNDTGVESSLATVHVQADAISVASLLPTAIP